MHILPRTLPESIAIAGAFGYIGSLYLQASANLGIEQIFVYDPAPVPAQLIDMINTGRVKQIKNETEFYELNADLFHIAMHPQQRNKMFRLIERGMSINCEKPMAHPEQPELCDKVIKAVKSSNCTVLYDFPELFDSYYLGMKDDSVVLEHLADMTQLDSVWIKKMFLHRSKDRESDNEKNKRVVLPIQYQESVHCIAFMLQALGAVNELKAGNGSMNGTFKDIFSNGVFVDARSEPYEPPNKESYPYVVDGLCIGRICLNNAEVEIYTNFKKEYQAVRRQTIIGAYTVANAPLIANESASADFYISFGVDNEHRYINFDGCDMMSPKEARQTPHESVITKSWKLHSRAAVDECFRNELMTGLYPNPYFAMLTFKLSDMLWKSCWQNKPVQVSSLAELESFSSEFANEMPNFRKYKTN